MEDIENHEELVCANHDFVHKSEVDPAQKSSNTTKGVFVEFLSLYRSRAGLSSDSCTSL